MPSPAAIPADLDALPDEQLMAAYAGGDAHAFDALYARHESALYRFIRRLLGMRLAAEADDVFQATWGRIVSARDSYSPQRTTWRAWAFAIAYSLAMDRLHTSGRQVAYYAHDEDGDGLEAARLFGRGLLRDEASADDDAANPSAQELAFWQAAGRRLIACLDELPDNQRGAFLLHHEDGFTVEAMAAALDLDADTVRTRLRFGLRKLRGCMERYLVVLGRRE
jgi:RNA polymerase sigma-70 factor (ECF subfamily)